MLMRYAICRPVSNTCQWDMQYVDQSAELIAVEKTVDIKPSAIMTLDKESSCIFLDNYRTTMDASDWIFQVYIKLD